MQDQLIANSAHEQKFNKKHIISLKIKKETLVEVISFLFILLFLYASISKLLDYEKFVIQLAKSPLISRFNMPVSIAIPTIEIAIALLLAINKTQLLGLYCSYGIMLLFTEYIIYIMNFSDNIPCSCGGVLQHLSWGQHLIFNFLFLILSLVGVFYKKARAK